LLKRKAFYILFPFHIVLIDLKAFEICAGFSGGVFSLQLKYVILLFFFTLESVLLCFHFVHAECKFPSV